MKDHEDAVEACSSMSAQIAVIHSQHEQDFLTAYLGHQELRKIVWIGLKKQYSNYQDYKLRWNDDTRANYTNFAPGQPNGEDQQLCFHMLASKVSAGKWSDKHCYKTIGYICQLNLVESSTPSDGLEQNEECPPGFKFYLGSCYYLDEIEEDWFKAEEKCSKKHEGHLVSILDMYELAFVNLLSGKVNNEIWIGLSDTNKASAGKFMWSDNRPIYHSNWEKKEPSGGKSGQRCVAMQTNKKWKVRDCNEKRSFICVKHHSYAKEHPVISEPILGTCPSHFIDVGNQYCYFITSENLEVPFSVAEKECADMAANGTLAMFRSEHELSLFRQHLARHSTKRFTVGIQESEWNVFSYVTEPEEEASYLPWSEGEPNNPEHEKCVELVVEEMKYNNYPCNDPHLYICQAGKITYPKITAKPEKKETGGLSAGGASAIVIFLMCALAFVGFYFYRKRILDNQMKEGTAIFFNEAVDKTVKEETTQFNNEAMDKKVEEGILQLDDEVMDNKVDELIVQFNNEAMDNKTKRTLQFGTEVMNNKVGE